MDIRVEMINYSIRDDPFSLNLQKKVTDALKQKFRNRIIKILQPVASEIEAVNGIITMTFDRNEKGGSVTSSNCDEALREKIKDLLLNSENWK